MTYDRRFLPLSGIAFVALVVLALLVGGKTPGSGASVEEVARLHPFASIIAMLATAIWIVLAGVTTARGGSAEPAIPVPAARQAGDFLAIARPHVSD